METNDERERHLSGENKCKRAVHARGGKRIETSIC